MDTWPSGSQSAPPPATRRPLSPYRQIDTIPKEPDEKNTSRLHSTRQSAVTERLRDFFGTEAPGVPDPSAPTLLWLSATLYAIIILVAAVGLFAYSFAFQDCGWKQQVYDPRPGTCGFRATSGTRAEDPSASGTATRGSGVTIKYSYGGQGVVPFFKNSTCSIIFDRINLGPTVDTTKNALKVNQTRAGIANFGSNVGGSPMYQYPSMTCGGTNGFNITIFSGSPFLPGVDVPGGAMFENISGGLDTLYKKFGGIDSSSAVFDSPLIIKSLLLSIYFYADTRPTNYLSSVDYIFGRKEGYTIVADSVDAFLNGANYTSETQQGIFKLAVRDAVGKVVLDASALRRSVEAEVEQYLLSQDTFWCYSCGNWKWYDSLFFMGPNVSTLYDLLASFFPLVLGWIAAVGARRA
ncbi:hypothetical protein HDU93_000363 [Gonapodya sp. JEL0774]|nr:hypothetical protein HDU93_000363 [Gonapodya sp. JEL0774]